MNNPFDQAPGTDHETSAIEHGHTPLSGEEIKARLAGKQFLGGYLNGFRYIISINDDGSLEGKNNCQHHDIGRWEVDMKENTLRVNWKYGWDNATTRVYEVDGEIRMYDQATGDWRTSLIQAVDEVQDIENYLF